MRNTEQDEIGTISTFSGIDFNILTPNPNNINIIDIAHSLSMQCRFTGHTPEFYSVAQHSVLVSRVVRPEFALQALFHDASEAYLTDIPRPLKPLMPQYETIEYNLTQLINHVFFIDPTTESTKAVEEADARVCLTEMRDLMKANWVSLVRYPCPILNFKIEPVDPKAAKLMFLSRYLELTEV